MGQFATKTFTSPVANEHGVAGGQAMEQQGFDLTKGAGG